MKQVLSVLLLSVLLLLTGCSENQSEEAFSADPSSEAAAETVSAVEYIYFSPNYTENNGTLTASKTVSEKSEQSYSAAMFESELLEGDFAAEVEMTLDNVYAGGGILFRGSSSDLYDGIEGYALMLRDRRIYLYDMGGSKFSGMMPKELACRVIDRPQKGDTIRLRIERENNTFRLYYLDDMEGVEPWPEFEFILTEHRGIGIGVIDNGQGASFRNLTVTEYHAPPSAEKKYKNPVFSDLQAADPYVLYHDGRYYCYSTSAPIGYYVYVSDDLVKWENAGLCLEKAWGIDKSGWYWAPEVIEHNGRFYMIMSVDEHLGFAVADSPLGPFEPEETWLFEKSIDGHVFIDDDGQAYLYYVSWRNGVYGIYGCELEEDIVSARPGTEKLLLSPEESWEKIDGSVTEGPFILKHNGLYYLTYSGTGYTSPDYAVGYAVSETPLGEFKRYDANPVLSRTSVFYGTGHHCFTYSPSGELMIVYHVHASTTEVHPRKVCIDRARFAPTESGVDRLEIWGPTHTAQDAPR